MNFLLKTERVSTAYRAPFTGTPSINEALSLLHAPGILPGKFAQSKQTHTLTSQAQFVQTEQPRDNVLMTSYQWKIGEKYSLLTLLILFTGAVIIRRSSSKTRLAHLKGQFTRKCHQCQDCELDS